MNPGLIKSIVEGLIFSHSEPLSIDELSRVLPDVSGEALARVIAELEEEYRLRNRGFILIRTAGGHQFRSVPEIAPWILELKKAKPARLSRAALETLSIIAYNQPITRGQIEQIRGVESSASIKNLLGNELIKIMGRKEAAGRPLLYGTTKRFLEVFSLEDLKALPPLPDKELSDIEEKTPE